MDYSDSILKFVTLRNASDEIKEKGIQNIQPKTSLTDSLVAILESDKKNTEKISAINEKLGSFTKSEDFYKSASQVPDQEKLSTGKNIKSLYENLYDNIVARVVTKSNTTEVFQSLVTTTKKAFAKLNPQADESKLQIILPKGLNIMPGSAAEKTAPANNDNDKKAAQIVGDIRKLSAEKAALKTSIKAQQAKVTLEQEKILTPQFKANESTAGKEASALKSRTIPEKANLAQDNVEMKNLSSLHTQLSDMEKQDTDISVRLQDLYMESLQYAPTRIHSYIGGNYIDTTIFKDKPPIITPDSISVYSKGCYLKFPFKIADLRVVEQKVVGYLPDTISHINNTQPGETNTRKTRKLKRIELDESLISEDEITKESDVTSTDKFSLAKAASQVQSQETNVNVNASASGTYGVVTASLDAGFSHSESSENSNTSSQNYAKEVVQKVVDIVTHKVKTERSSKTTEEYEEEVEHIIDNTLNKDPQCHIYRFLTMIIRATLKNYGKCLMFDLDIAHPSHYYLSRSIKQPDKVEIPEDPRKLDREKFPEFSIQNINKDNISFWESLYKVKLDAPPAEKIIIATHEIKSQKLDITDGYNAKKAYVSITAREDGDQFYELSLIIGRKLRIDAYRDNLWGGIWENHQNVYLLDDETKNLPIALMNVRSGGLQGTIEIECEASETLKREWQTKCYFAIIQGYEDLKAEAEARMSTFNPNNPGLNPSRKTDIIRTELKKGAIQKMNRCNPFWLTDKYEAGKEYEPDCCTDNANAEIVRFLEDTFDWKNMTYQLYPYYYNSHVPNSKTEDNWAKLLNLTDDDPHFEAFLQASYATIRVPVFREPNKEKAALNYILNQSVGNFAVLPDGIQNLLDDLDGNTPFGYIDETPTSIPFVKIIKEYDRSRNLIIYYEDAGGNRITCTEVEEYDKEGNLTTFYYNAATSEVVISEIKEGVENGQKYNYYFNSANEKIITHKTKTETDIEGNSRPYYSTDLGIFNVPTDLVILEANTQDGIVVRGYPEDETPPLSDVVIPKQYSPKIIQDER